MSELSQEARALIDSVSKLDDPSAGDRARVKQRLSLALSATAFTALAVTTHVAAGTGSGLLGGAKAGLWGTTGKLALCAGVLGGALVVSWPSDQARPKPAPAERQAAPALAREAEPAAQIELAPSALSLPTPAQAPAADVSSRAERAARQRAPAAETTAPAEGEITANEKRSLGLELALLAEAQAALRAGHPEQALALSRQHQARFPEGVLREERLGIEALAECDLGGKDSAHAQLFLRAIPGSPLAARVRKACGLE